MVSISACHAEDPGSIPGRGEVFAACFFHSLGRFMPESSDRGSSPRKVDFVPNANFDLGLKNAQPLEDQNPVFSGTVTWKQHVSMSTWQSKKTPFSTWHSRNKRHFPRGSPEKQHSVFLVVKRFQPPQGGGDTWTCRLENQYHKWTCRFKTTRLLCCTKSNFILLCFSSNDCTRTGSLLQ